MSHTTQTNKEVYNTPVDDQVYRFLGLVALAGEHEVNKDYLEQQIVTELAESLDTEMGTHDEPIEMAIKNSSIYSKNGDNLTQSLHVWKEQWLTVSAKHDEYTWFAGIASAEADEIQEVAEFANSAQVGDLVLVVSPFPEEAYGSLSSRKTVAERGFRPDIRRSFMRVYEKTNTGINEHIQSVDSSSVALWNVVFSQFGQDYARTAQEILERRIRFSGINPNELIGYITHLYDTELESITNQEHSYGRGLARAMEANQFVRRHPAIVQDTIKELRGISEVYTAGTIDTLAEVALYKSKALIAELFEEYRQTGSVKHITEIGDARSGAGAIAQAEGKTFFGCSGESGPLTKTSVISDGTQLDALSSFSVRLVNHKKTYDGLEIHPCVNCPMCGRTVDAVYDPKAKAYSCVRSSCKGYNKAMVLRSKNKLPSHESEKTFGELLAELIFGKDDTNKSHSGN